MSQRGAVYVGGLRQVTGVRVGGIRGSARDTDCADGLAEQSTDGESGSASAALAEQRQVRGGLVGMAGQVGAIEVWWRGTGFLFHGARGLRHLSPGSQKQHASFCPQPFASEERSGWRCGLPSLVYSLGKLRPGDGKRLPTELCFSGKDSNSFCPPLEDPSPALLMSLPRVEKPRLGSLMNRVGLGIRDPGSRLRRQLCVLGQIPSLAGPQFPHL